MRAPWIAALVALALYLPTLANGFIRDNDAHLAEPGWVDRIPLARAFTDNSWHVVYEARYYRPLVFATHKLDAALYGTQAWGLHLTNVLLYAALCALVAAALARAGCTPAWQVALAALFALHPSHAECVAWISGRSDLLAALAGGGALLAAARGRALAAGTLLFAALLAKEVGAAYALVLAGAAVARRDARLGAAVGAAGAAYAALRAVALGAVGAGGAAGAGSSGGATEVALLAALYVKCAGRYVAMLVTGQTWGAFAWDEVVARHHLLGTRAWDAHLALELDAELAWAAVALGALALVSVGAWRRLRRSAGDARDGAIDAAPGEADDARGVAGGACALGVVALALSFTALSFGEKLNFADRYLLVPSWAAVVAVGAWVGRAGAPGRAAVAALVVVGVAWAGLAAGRSARYRDPWSFAEGAVGDNPLSGVAWQMLATRRAEAGDALGAWDARVRALALHGELVESFDARSGPAVEAWRTAVINAARWRTPGAAATLARARARLPRE